MNVHRYVWALGTFVLIREIVTLITILAVGVSPFPMMSLVYEFLIAAVVGAVALACGASPKLPITWSVVLTVIAAIILGLAPLFNHASREPEIWGQWLSYFGFAGLGWAVAGLAAGLVAWHKRSVP